MNGMPLLVLDFDGVICDSIDECFVSSWIAYHTLYRNDPPLHVPVTLRKEFARLRPFIRSGEDYLLIQEALSAGRRVEDQAGFDALSAAAGREKMAAFKERFMQARKTLLAKDRPFWLSLNTIYPHMLAAFAHIPRGAPVSILSTKAPEFIVEILEHAQIHFPRERILKSASESKLPAVEEMRTAAGLERAVFIDDQIDYLLDPSYTRVEAYLASWGYVKQEWLKGDRGVRIITPEGLLKLVAGEYSGK